jgi:hypothetical protein
MRTISLTAHRRPHYLAQTLEALSDCVGIERYRVTVFCDSGHAKSRDCVRVVESAGFEPVLTRRRLGCAANTGRAIAAAFDAGAPYHLHLEEDTVPSRGALLWFEWAERLGTDASIFSVTGYNREPSGASHEWSTRTWFTPWGFATWADRWEEEMRWRRHIRKGWDVRLNRIRGNRCEAFPCISRVQNIGALGGAHVPSAEWHAEHHAAREVTDDLTETFVLRS